jgi:hypothetical protein
VYRGLSRERINKSVAASFVTEPAELHGGEGAATDGTSVGTPTENVVRSDDVFETPSRELAGLILQNGFGGLPTYPRRGRKASGTAQSLGPFGTD